MNTPNSTEINVASTEINAGQSLLSRIPILDLLDGLGVFASVFTPSGHLVEVNRLSLDVTGYRREELLPPVRCWEWRVFAYDAQVARQVREGVERCGRGQRCQFEVTASLANGMLIDVEMTLHPLVEEQAVVAILATAVDLTPRKRVEAELRNRQRQLQVLVQKAPAILVEIDRDEVVTMLEGRQLERADVVPEACVGRKFVEAFPNCPTALAAIRSALAGQETSIIIEDHGIVIDVRYTPVRDEQAAVTGVIGVAVDVTDHYRAEAQLHQAQNDLAHAGRLSVMGQMAASIAHDLNQPLTSISTIAFSAQELLKSSKEGLSRRIADMLKAIETQALQAGEVIRRFREFSRKGKPKQSVCSLAALVGEVVEMSAPMIRKLGVTAKVDVSAALAPLFVDRIQLQQVFFNLIRNALEAMEQCDPANRHLSIRAVPGGDCVEIIVRDSGSGVPANLRRHVFEPWDTSKPSGLGLGLAISRSLVEAHGGTLDLIEDSEPGAAFRIQLPIHSEGVIDES